jgi:Dolichyl-phosphate-mannose-protein mannosyltransferase
MGDGSALAVGDCSENRPAMFTPPLPLAAISLLFVASLGVNLIGIDFPVYWHPDELSKAAQLQSGLYNFNHPQLLLRLSALADLALPGDTTRDAILAGRVVSALAVAAAVACFAILVYRKCGLLAGLAAGVLVAITPAVFISAHFYKEDSVLLLGIALSMLAMQYVDEAPTPRRACLLGCALGIVGAAKYVGIIMLVPAVFLVLHKPKPWRLIGCCLGFGVLTFALINSPAILQPSLLALGFQNEVNHVAVGHSGLVWGPLSPRTLLHFLQNTSVVLVVVLVGSMWAAVRLGGAMDRIVIFVPVLWLAVVQLSAVSFPRYVMPAAALSSVAVVWAIALLPRLRPHLRVVLASVVIAGAIFQLRPFATAISAFLDNPRDRAAAWMRQNLPSSAVVATDFFVGLPTSERIAIDATRSSLPQKVVDPGFFLSRAGSLSQLRERGVTHVAVSSSNFQRFFDPFVTFSEWSRAQRRFYEELFQLAPLHSESEAVETDIILSSLILIYDIRDLSIRGDSTNDNAVPRNSSVGTAAAGWAMHEPCPFAVPTTGRPVGGFQGHRIGIAAPGGVGLAYEGIANDDLEGGQVRLIQERDLAGRRRHHLADG